MIIKGLIDEDFVNYKKPAMYIAFPSCTWKCERECGMRVCQNGALAQAPAIVLSTSEIVDRYINNPLTSSIIMAGLEPLDSEKDMVALIQQLRLVTQDDIIIYTGYSEEEVKDRQIYKVLLQAKNVVVKFGRFVPNQQPHYDEVLGVKLASDNQYARRIS